MDHLPLLSGSKQALWDAIPEIEEMHAHSALHESTRGAWFVQRILREMALRIADFEHPLPEGQVVVVVGSTETTEAKAERKKRGPRGSLEGRLRDPGRAVTTRAVSHPSRSPRPQSQR